MILDPDLVLDPVLYLTPVLYMNPVLCLDPGLYLNPVLYLPGASPVSRKVPYLGLVPNHDLVSLANSDLQ